MLLRLLPLVCLLAAAAAQRTYYCNSFIGTIRDTEFYLHTVNENERFYSPNLLCGFNAESNNLHFLVEIETFDTLTAVLTISSMSNIFFSGYQLAGNYQKAIVTTTSNLRVNFEAKGDYSRKSGVKLRVRAFDRNGCPPDWQYLYGNCYGTSTITGRLNYTNAQRACNSMRSNLLHLPRNYAGSLNSFKNMLSTNLKTYYTWIGLTDRSTRYRHTWLDGSRQFSTDSISCVSGGTYSTCFSTERCGALYDKNSFYAVYMDKCGDADNYACSMPPGGTNVFYSIPYLTDSSIYDPPITYVSSGVIWGSIAACIVIGCIVFIAIYGGVRRNQLMRAAGATGVVVSAGRVTTPGSLQVQVQQSATVYYPPPQAVPPPPAYNVAVGGGYPGNMNMGYSK